MVLPVWSNAPGLDPFERRTPTNRFDPRKTTYDKKTIVKPKSQIGFNYFNKWLYKVYVNRQKMGKNTIESILDKTLTADFLRVWVLILKFFVKPPIIINQI